MSAVLTDNREQLVSRNMLDEGNTRAAAEQAVDQLLQVVTWFRGAEMRLGRQQDHLDLNIALHLQPDAEIPQAGGPGNTVDVPEVRP